MIKNRLDNYLIPPLKVVVSCMKVSNFTPSVLPRPPTYNLTTYLLTNAPTHLFTYLLTHPPTHLLIYYLPTYPPTHLPTYLPTYILITYLPTHPPICTTYLLAYFQPSYLCYHNEIPSSKA